MKKYAYTLLITFLAMGFSQAQGIEEEIEFKYIKAKYLLDTERYEDAIKAFSEIINMDAGYNDALIQRAQAKYAMAAFKGTKKDVLEYVELKGVTPQGVVLLGMAEYKMGNMDAALNSLTTATYFEDADANIFLYIGNIYEEKQQDNEACYFWRMAAKKGSSKGAIKLKDVCNDVVKANDNNRSSGGRMDGSSLPTSTDNERRSQSPDDVSIKDKPRTEEQVDDDKEDTGGLGGIMKDKILVPKKDDAPSSTEEEEDPENTDVDTTTDEDTVREDDDMLLPPDDNTPNEIEIDADLTLVVRGQGLGKRKILDQPNILILSDEDGVVAVDICVNRRGKIESAEFNTKLSTIAKKSLVSLAIRKAKDFWFEKNDYKEQCGVIMFKIKGS